MDAKKCDRCGQFYLPSDRGFNYPVIYMSPGAYRNERPIDLCPDCSLDVKRYINNSKDSDNQ